MPVIVRPAVASFFKGTEYCTHPDPITHGWKLMIANWHPRTGVDVIVPVAALVGIRVEVWVGVRVWVAVLVLVGVFVAVSVGVFVGVLV